MGRVSFLMIPLILFSLTAEAKKARMVTSDRKQPKVARQVKKPATAKRAPASVKPVAKVQASAPAKANQAAQKPAASSQERMKAALTSAIPTSSPSGRRPGSVDSNAALEVRGQARTLSMMLVLKNGKDGINFIKVRKDYRPEIQATEF